MTESTIADKVNILFMTKSFKRFRIIVSHTSNDKIVPDRASVDTGFVKIL